MPNDPIDAGPLPCMDANAQLQERSLTAFRVLLKNSPFLIRDERSTDYGVDLTLEAVVGGHPTDFRSHVQVKAVTALRPNADGARSKSIETKNLNYLLNGPAPIYVLYVADEDSLFAVFAVDALLEIEKTTPAWKTQGTVTLHFRKRLSSQQLTTIHERIIKEARWHREMRERLAAATSREAVVVAVNAETLRTCDGPEAHRILEHSGLTIVTNGFAKDALRLIDLLDFDLKLGPRIQLVSAYAWLSLGRPLNALAAVGEATSHFHQLSLADRQMLVEIRDAAECMTGRISKEEFVGRLSHPVDQVTGVRRDECQVDRLRFAFLAERDLFKAGAILSRLRSAVELLLTQSEYSTPYKLQARLHVAYCEGCYRSGAITHAVSLLGIRRKLALRWVPSAMDEVLDSIKAYAAWERDMQSLINEAIALGIPLLRAEALRTRLVVRTFVLWGQRFASQLLGLRDESAPEAFDAPREDGQRAVSDFKQAGNLNGELRSQMHLADLYELAGNVDAAKQLASEVLPMARAMQMQDIVASAEAHLAGKTLLKTTEEGMLADRQADQDVRNAALTNEELDAYAADCLRVANLPADRWVPVRVDIGSWRYAAQQRLHWCRSLELIQDLEHTKHQQTAYVTVPTYYGRCSLHRYESPKGACDYQLTLDRFRTLFCSACKERSPKLE